MIWACEGFVRAPVGCVERPGGVCCVWEMIRVVIDPFLGSVGCGWNILTLSCWLFTVLAGGRAEGEVPGFL